MPKLPILPILRGLLLTAVLAAAPLLGAAAGEGDPVLTVTGDIEAAGGGPVELSIADLRAMGAVELRTTTRWTEGVQTFVGVPGSRFVEAIGGRGREVIAVAVNDYKVTLPYDVLASDDLLLAFLRNGKEMSIREKGPMWIVFPYDSDPRFSTSTYYAYSVWSLIGLEFR